MQNQDPTPSRESANGEHIVYAGLAPEALADIGRIAIWAAWVEHHLDDIVSELIDPRYDVGRAITAGKTAAGLIEQTRTILQTATWRGTTAAERLLPLLGRAKAALAERNSVLHGIVSNGLQIAGDEPEIVISSRRNRAGVLRPLEDLDAMARELHEVGNALFEAGFEIGREHRRRQQAAH